MSNKNNTKAHTTSVFEQPKGTSEILEHVGYTQTKQAKVKPNFRSTIFVAATLHHLHVQQLN